MNNMQQHINGAAQAMQLQQPQQMLSPEDEARLEKNIDTASTAALHMFYGNGHNDFMKMIPQGEEIAGVALVTATLIEAVDDKSGGQMPEDVIVPAALETAFGEHGIADFLQKKGMPEFSDQDHGRVIAFLIKKLAEDYGTTPNQVREAMQSGDPQALQAGNQQVEQMKQEVQQQGGQNG